MEMTCNYAELNLTLIDYDGFDFTFKQFNCLIVINCSNKSLYLQFSALENISLSLIKTPLSQIHIHIDQSRKVTNFK